MLRYFASVIPDAKHSLSSIIIYKTAFFGIYR